MQADVLQVVSYCEIYYPLNTPNANNPAAQFLLTAGSVNIDATAAVRSTLSGVTLAPFPVDPLGEPIPQVPTDLLFPDGNEIVVYKGCQYSDGTQEVVPLGRFLMEDVEIYDDGSGSGGIYVTLNGSDRSQTISRAKFTQPYTTDGISTLDIQIQAMISSQVAGLTFNFTTGGGPFPTPAPVSFNADSDPWASALQIAADSGYEMFFDELGVCVMQPPRNPLYGSIAAVYAPGPSNIVTTIDRSENNQGVPNLVIVTSQGSNVPTPLRSVWWDDNPNSPTFYNLLAPPLLAGAPIPAPAGLYPTTTASNTGSTATTQTANDQAAQALFLGTAGAFETITFKIRDNPAHEVGDVVSILDSSIGPTANSYLIDSMVIQCTSTPEMELKGRLVTT